MLVIHFSKNPFSIKKMRYKQEHLAKPAGLWVTMQMENSWDEWCIAESFRTENLAHNTQMELDTTNIKMISTHDELETFTKEYGINIFDDPMFDGHWIDWVKLSKEYSGIVIAPYIWSARLNRSTSWYYGWDCASGCIWKLDCLKIID